MLRNETIVLPPGRHPAAKNLVIFPPKSGKMTNLFDANSPPRRPACQATYSAPGRAGRQGCRGRAQSPLQKELPDDHLSTQITEGSELNGNYRNYGSRGRRATVPCWNTMQTRAIKKTHTNLRAAVRKDRGSGGKKIVEERNNSPPTGAASRGKEFGYLSAEKREDDQFI